MPIGFHNTLQAPAEETKPEDLFGKRDALEKPKEISEPTSIVQKAIAAKNVVYQHSAKHLKEDLNELAVHLDEKEVVETKKEEFVESLINNEKIREEEITAFIKSPKLKLKN